MKLNDIENEVVFLKAVKELIDSMINFEVLDIVGNDPDCNVVLKTMTHQTYFNIILVDFLSCADVKGFVKQNSFLGALRYICENPSFDVNSSVSNLRVATNDFVQWLRHEAEVECWLPSIEAKIILKIPRIDFLKICGNISKHNFLRSIDIANSVKDILARNGKVIELDEALQVLGDFYERFHVDIFNYHSSTIAEYLNELRWGIYEYLQPEFNRAIIWEVGPPPKYRYDIPNTLTVKFARDCYWDLMNEVRMKPFMRRFKVTKYLKMRY